jgi:hypothetical protein
MPLFRDEWLSPIVFTHKKKTHHWRWQLAVGSLAGTASKIQIKKSQLIYLMLDGDNGMGIGTSLAKIEQTEQIYHRAFILNFPTGERVKDFYPFN